MAEVIVDSDGTFEFTPVLGDQRILFGDLSGMKEKFNNLFVVLQRRAEPDRMG